MRLTLQEAMDTCKDWDLLCSEQGFSEWVVAEGGGHIVIDIDIQKAHKYGIVKLPDWKVKKDM